MKLSALLFADNKTSLVKAKIETAGKQAKVSKES